jgi:hypothetical protein
MSTHVEAQVGQEWTLAESELRPVAMAVVGPATGAETSSAMRCSLRRHGLRRCATRISPARIEVLCEVGFRSSATCGAKFLLWLEHTLRWIPDK